MTTDLLAVLTSLAAAVACLSWLLGSWLRERGRRWVQGFDTELGAGLRQAFLYVEPSRLFWMNLVGAAALGGCAAALLGGGVALLVGVLAAGTVPSLLLRYIQLRRQRRFAAQWPEAVMLVAGSLSAGAGLIQAIAQVSRDLPAPAGQELDLMMREHRLGVSLDAALGHLEERMPQEGVTLFVAALRIAQESGGNLAETLERLSAALRRKAEVEGRIDALTAQGRLQGWVMGVLPLVIGGALVIIDPDAMRPLFTTWQGAGVCGLVMVLLGLGLSSLRRIVDIDV